jgi:hypothetical protein
MAYPVPTAAEFKASYPTFAATPDGVVDAALAYAVTRVGTDWTDADGTLGVSYFAAHQLTLDGHGTMAKTAAHRAAGIQSMKSGTMSAEFTRGTEDASFFRLTSWGARYLEIAGRYEAGPLVVGGRPACRSHLAQDLPFIVTRRW